MTESNLANTSFEKRTANLFEESLAIELGVRPQFILERSAKDSRLAQAVLALLAIHESSDGQEESEFILDKPLGLAVRDTFDDPSTADISEREGDTIGRYKLLERIGEGGMGVVYMAEQTADVRRRVALKIIKLGLDTRQVVARFGAERQAMAMFDHPGITRILDAGTTDSGRPYYVMELVKGQDVIGFSNRHKLTISDRLVLFIEICNAVQHSHQKGIIHRDIKPSNVLVAIVDGKPAPKIIDFGIAKALHHRLTDQTLFTRYSAMVGTPQYMSPEQAESSGVDADTRSDIYSLGVLLYELVTGTTPLSKEKLAELNPLALIETLKNHAIETPSTRISQIGSDFGESTMHLKEAHGKLDRELDWIAMKALVHDRRQRYQSASELAADVQRYLNGDVVEAVAPSRFYKLQTHFRKHRMLYSVGTICAALVFASSIFCAVFAIKSHYANREKNTALKELSQKNEQLLEAQGEIERQNLATRLKKIVGLTVMRLSFEEMKDATTAMMEKIETAQMHEGLIEIEQPLDSDCPLASVTFCAATPIDISYTLASMELKDVVATSLKTIVDIIEEEEKISFGIQELLPDMELENALQHTMIPTRAEEFENFENEKRAPEQIQKQLLIFLRILSEEYNREFGESDPQVASARNMLAAALIQCGEFDEANATLREAIAIATSSESKTVSRKLIEICQEKRNNVGTN